MEAYTTRYLASIFTPEFTIGNYSKLIGLFQGIGGEKLEGDVTSLPIPQDAPPEIPRLIIYASDKSWVAQVCPLRTDVFFHRIGMLEEAIPDFSTFTEFACKIFTGFLEFTGTSVQRLSCVKERVIDAGDEDPAKFIAKRFCRDEFLDHPLNEPNHFEIHALKKYNWQMLPDFHVNSWVRIKSAFFESFGKKMVLFINDFNTFSVEEAPENRFNLDDINRFYQNAPKEIESIFMLYFEEE